MKKWNLENKEQIIKEVKKYKNILGSFITIDKEITVFKINGNKKVYIIEDINLKVLFTSKLLEVA